MLTGLPSTSSVVISAGAASGASSLICWSPPPLREYPRVTRAYGMRPMQGLTFPPALLMAAARRSSMLMASQLDRISN